MRMFAPLPLALCAALAYGPAWANSSGAAETEAPAGNVETEAPAGDVEAGMARFQENCVNCHGKEGKGMASFPALVGHDADYIADRLRAYRAKEKVGPNSALMYSWAAPLSDEEIANLAAYVSATFQ